ncbi:MAG TPA: hypothetical protein DCX53_16555 [Anaerolineae bacterium]|nr:hypothetical protein [Anaerolineae bacterium]
MKLRYNTIHPLTILTILGFALFIVKSWNSAHSHLSIGDEGAYLYKGYMFARGDFQPFQDYGFWTNKAPLSFLIPGYIQLWFGPGLREGRYFAVLVSILMLAGMWISAHRLGGKGWAALTIWVFAVSSEQIADLSLTLSQGLVACMMAWMFVLLLGEKRSPWQLMAGAAVSVLVVMTRQNMVVVPLFVVAYIFWQHGIKAGWQALGIISLILIGFHIYYWPNILQLWTPWLPNISGTFTDVIPGSPSPNQSLEIGSILSRARSFAENVHHHFVIMLGSISALILWPAKKYWKDKTRYKTVVFLAATYFCLFLMHLWASLFNDYCIWCLSSYQGFYNSAGILLIVGVFSIKRHGSKYNNFILISYLLFISANLGLYYSDWGDWLLQNILLPLPGRLFAEGNLSTVTLANFLTHVSPLPFNLQRRVAAVIGGFLCGLLIIMLTGLLHKWVLRGSKWNRRFSFSYSVLICFTIIGILLPNGQNSDRARDAGNCSNNYLTYYEETGRALRELAPPNSRVYWRGSGNHLALMLYMDNIEIFPPQIHAGGGFKSLGDNETLLKRGLFNNELDAEWRNKADFFVLWEEYLTEDARKFFTQPGYEMIPFDMGGLDLCEEPFLVFIKR